MTKNNENLFEIPVNILFLNGSEELYHDKEAVESGCTICPAPFKATPGSAGFDLRAVLPEDTPCVIKSGERFPIKAGIALEPLRAGIAAFVYSRSGLGAVKGLTVAQGVGVIDPDYRGEITVFLLNTSQQDLTVRRGERIAQMVFQPFYQPVFNVVEQLGKTQRGSGGFGHTGI